MEVEPPDVARNSEKKNFVSGHMLHAIGKKKFTGLKKFHYVQKHRIDASVGPANASKV